MCRIVCRRTQIITQDYNSKKHRGLDLRTVNFITRLDQKIICPEQSIVKRQGKDRYGNYFVVLEPLKSAPFFTELKFIHLNQTNFIIRQIVEQGDIIGTCIIGGNSKAKHLHFEVKRGKSWLNPIDYLNYWGIPYKYKWRTA